MHHHQCRGLDPAVLPVPQGHLDFIVLALAVFRCAFTTTIRDLNVFFGYGTLIGNDGAAGNGRTLRIGGSGQVGTTGNARTVILLLGREREVAVVSYSALRLDV